MPQGGEDTFPPEDVPRRRTGAFRTVSVVLAAFVVAMFLGADALERTAQRQPLGWPRDVALAVAEPVAALSHTLFLDRPQIWLAQVTGHAQDTDITPTDHIELADPGAVAEVAEIDDQDQSTPAPEATTTTTVAPRRRPTPEDPVRILVAGDSLVNGIAGSLANELAGRDATIITDEHPGTGLARPDVVDWPRELTEAMDTHDPEVVVLMFGGNDMQALRTPDGWVRPTETDAWRDEYERRIAQLMEIAARPGVTVYWIGLPVIRSPAMQARVPMINFLIALEAHVRAPDVVFVDPGPAVTGPDGGYTAEIIGDDGHSVIIRHDDGVHLTMGGAKRVTDLFLDRVIAERNL